MDTNYPTQKQRIFEIIAVVFTAFGKLVFMDYLNLRFPFVIIATIFWIGYILYQTKNDKGLARYWGFRIDNFKKAFLVVLPLGILSVILFIAFGFIQNTINLTWHILPILVLYPIWGTIQQFLLIGLTVGNLKDMNEVSLDKRVIMLLAALLFGVIHYPYLWLMVATFFLALFYGWVYLKERNLYVLGLFHGWLGAIFYYTILDRDPFIETFGIFFNK